MSRKQMMGVGFGACLLLFAPGLPAGDPGPLDGWTLVCSAEGAQVAAPLQLRRVIGTWDDNTWTCGGAPTNCGFSLVPGGGPGQ